jgi:immunity protein, SdpI family
MTIRRPLIVSALLVLAMAALSLAATAALPATVPLRFNAHGIATAYGSPLASLALMPLIALVLSAVFAACAQAEPRRENLRRSFLPYATRWIGAIVIAGIVHLWIVYTLVTTVRGAAPLDPTRMIFVLVGAMIAVAGSQLARLRSNFMIGIRTPWTLADDQVWQRTHRLARRPAMLSGLAIVLAALFAPEAILLKLKLTLGIVIVVAAGFVLLSYLLWRRRDARLRS